MIDLRARLAASGGSSRIGDIVQTVNTTDAQGRDLIPLDGSSVDVAAYPALSAAIGAEMHIYDVTKLELLGFPNLTATEVIQTRDARYIFVMTDRTLHRVDTTTMVSAIIATWTNGASWVVNCSSDGRYIIAYSGGRIGQNHVDSTHTYKVSNDYGATFTSTDFMMYNSRSAYRPGISPDGRYMSFTFTRASSDRQFMYSSDYGVSWNEFNNSSNAPDRNLMYEADGSKVYGEFSASNGFMSADAPNLAWTFMKGNELPAGETWTEYHIDRAIPANRIIMASSDKQWQYSTDTHTTWTVLPLPIAPTSVKMIEIDNGELQLWDVDGDVHISSDWGVTWVKIGSMLPATATGSNMTVMMQSHVRTRGIIYYYINGTIDPSTDRGVMKAKIGEVAVLPVYGNHAVDKIVAG